MQSVDRSDDVDDDGGTCVHLMCMFFPLNCVHICDFICSQCARVFSQIFFFFLNSCVSV